MNLIPDDDFTSPHYIRELEQEKKLLEKINRDLENKSKITQYEKNQLKKELETFRHDTKELEMAKKFLEKIIIDEKEKSKKLTKKYSDYCRSNNYNRDYIYGIFFDDSRHCRSRI